MFEIFESIRFREHRLHEDGVHGIYEIDDKSYVSVCSGGGSYGKLNKIDYWILVKNKHKGWSNHLKSTFEVAYVDRESGELMNGENGNVVSSELSPKDVEEIIKKIKQGEDFELN